MSRFSLVVAALTLPLVVVPARAQPRPGAAELPVKQVILYSSGVGYYQREGAVDGAARIDLQFHTANINDLLKSLVLQDANGGQVGTVSYDSRNPVEMTLKSFAIDLTSNPSLGDLLNQVRGESVEVLTMPDGRANGVGQTETLTGTIVGVEKKRQSVGKDQVIETAQLNLLTGDGLRGVPLGQVQRVKFLKPALEQEFRKALEVLATGHDKQKKTVSLHFTGTGKRQVRVGYVTESPIWKTSYRLSLEKNRMFLQGWAVVENTTDEDWANVDLRLVSGRPVSFQMDLYQPLFVPRPVVEPELFASLRPQVYGGAMDKETLFRREMVMESKTEPLAAPAPASPEAALPGQPGMAGMAGAMGGMGMARRGGANRGLLSLGDTRARSGLNFHESVASAATGTELGEHFQYVISQPVSLPRQKSALIPIINEPVIGSKKVSIYNEGVHAKFPLLGLRFKNSTPLHLCQGPMTVFENGAYAGDARIDNLRPDESRLMSYAIDLGTEVEPKRTDTDELVKVKVIKGIIHSQFSRRETKAYTVKNRSDQARMVLVEHPYRSDFKLITPKKADERSRDVYRFAVNAEPDKPAELVVVEELPHVEQVQLASTDDETVRILLRTKAVSESVKKALQRALELRAAAAQARQEVQKEEQALKVIEQDQARMRANMERLPQTSEAYKRYLRKFDDQETEIEKRRARVAELQTRADQEQKAYGDYLANLTVE